MRRAQFMIRKRRSYLSLPHHGAIRVLESAGSGTVIFSDTSHPGTHEGVPSPRWTQGSSRFRLGFCGGWGGSRQGSQARSVRRFRFMPCLMYSPIPHSHAAGSRISTSGFADQRGSCR
jgi:hypothetical protein